MKTPELSTDKTECRSICLLGGDCESLIWFIILGLPRRQAHASDKILAATSAAATLQKQQLINNRIHFIYRTNANRLTSKKTKKKKKERNKRRKLYLHAFIKPPMWIRDWVPDWIRIGIGIFLAAALALVHLTEQNVRRDICALGSHLFSSALRCFSRFQWLYLGRVNEICLYLKPFGRCVSVDFN